MDGSQFDYSRTADSGQPESSYDPPLTRNSFDRRFYLALQDFVQNQNWMPVPQNFREVITAMYVLEERRAYYAGAPSPPPLKFEGDDDPPQQPVQHAKTKLSEPEAPKSDDEIRESIWNFVRLVDERGEMRAAIKRRRHYEQRALSIHIEVLNELLERMPDDRKLRMDAEALKDSFREDDCRVNGQSKIWVAVPDAEGLSKAELNLLIEVAEEALSNWSDRRPKKPR